MRNSNIELLRIISMFLIVLHHFSVHGTWIAGSSFSFDCAIQLLSFGGKLGVDVFILITGYFMIGKRFKSLSLLRVVAETWFYSYAVLIIFSSFEPSMIDLSNIKMALLPILSEEYWFISSYVGLIILSPFINFFWNKLSIVSRTRFMIVSFILFSIIPTITGLNPWASRLIWFIWVYLLGGYIRNWMEEPFEIRNILNPIWLVGKIGGIACAIVSILFTFGSIAFFELMIYKLDFTVQNPTYFIAQNMLPTIMAAIGLMIAFCKPKPRAIPAVNLIAKTTLGIYLIHDNPFVRIWIWANFESIYNLNWIGVLLGGITVSVCVFVICSCIDLLRIFALERPFFWIIQTKANKLFNYIDNWMNRVLAVPVKGSDTANKLNST